MGVWKQHQALARLEQRLDDVESQCADLKREAKKLDLEFTEIYDKVSRQMSRMAKRYAHDKKTPEVLEEEDQVTSPLDGLDPISRSIMLQRSGYRAGK